MAQTLSKRDLYMPSKLVDNFRVHLAKIKEDQKETIVEIIQSQRKKSSAAEEIKQE
jgi:hypothetical protein